ncbi:metallophosphoesterase family protein [Marinilactibacillus sp. GCM10026970]|uniref:metallophosphoesterase family protein n=1 Tax=Marinilactibacillus sp. GCM10026970 TaxID=3252642 RepID=UPI00361FA06A
MNIVHISDIHFRKTYEQSSEGYKGMLANMQSPLIPLTECLEEIRNKQEIDLLIISGDLTDDGEAEDYRFLKKAIRKIIGDTKVIVTLGNHDIKRQFREGWLNESPSDEPYNFIETFEDFHVISFDSAVYENSNGHVSDNQLKWLDQALERTQDKPVMLVTHHHLIEQQSSIPSLPEGKQVLERLQGNNTLCILSGHTHHAYKTKVENVPYFTVVGMSFVGEEIGEFRIQFEEKYGYNTYQIENGQIKHTEHQIISTGKQLKIVDMNQ